jgi:deazaflavin-dependent oxidoreductase (nitroreductase family)
MPAPYWLARFNSRVMNRIVAPLAPHLPGLGLLIHRGRKTGRRYRTPVNVWPREDRYVIALTYGPGTDWVRNVLASGSCILYMRGRRILLTQPRIFHDEQRRALPAPLRPLVGLAHIDDFLELQEAPARDQ